jgi:conjugal transfer pilin signal peptidase TrbI
MNIKLKFVVLSICLSIFMFGGSHYLTSQNWRVAYEQQAYLRCLPIELTFIKEQTVTKDMVTYGSLVSLDTKEYSDFYREGVTILKLIVGLPGDKIKMEQGSVYVNGDFISEYKSKDEDGVSPFFDGTMQLKEDEYWVAGSTSVALDSRYIGPVSLDIVKGKGYAIL